jgi:hypothetical protein
MDDVEGFINWSNKLKIIIITRKIKYGEINGSKKYERFKKIFDEW